MKLYINNKIVATLIFTLSINYIPQALLAYTYTISNKTDGEIKATLNYGVKSKPVTIGAGITKKISSGLYCLRSLIVQGTTGPVANLSAKRAIQLSNNQCLSHKITVMHEKPNNSKPLQPSLLPNELRKNIDRSTIHGKLGIYLDNEQPKQEQFDY